MVDPFSVFDYKYTMTLTRRTAGGFAAADGSWTAETSTTATITGHLIIGPYEEQARAADHILSGRAMQAGVIVERGEAILWTGDDVQVGDEIAIVTDGVAVEPDKTWLVVEEMKRQGSGLIAKHTGLRVGRRQMRLKAKAA